MSFSYLNYESSGKTIARLAALLSEIDPDVGYNDWVLALMVVFNVTHGSEAGFHLVDDWSSWGEKYRGTKDIKAKWRCFKPNHRTPVGIKTLIRIAEQH